MAVTEGFQMGVVNLAYDPAIVKKVPFTDSTTRKLERVDFYRVATNALICSVTVNVAVIEWKSGAYPVATKITQTKGITVMELT